MVEPDRDAAEPDGKPSPSREQAVSAAMFAGIAAVAGAVRRFLVALLGGTIFFDVLRNGLLPRF